jgi:DoxX-like protein
MFDFSFPVMAAWTNAAIFATAGLINFTAVKSVRSVYDRWDVSPGFYRPLGLVEIAAAACLAAPSLRFWGVLLAAPIFFGSVVMLLDHRHYAYAASVVLMMTGLAAALLAIPSAPEFALITTNHSLVQVAGGSQAY